MEKIEEKNNLEADEGMIVRCPHCEEVLTYLQERYVKASYTSSRDGNQLKEDSEWNLDSYQCPHCEEYLWTNYEGVLARDYPEPSSEDLQKFHAGLMTQKEFEEMFNI